MSQYTKKRKNRVQYLSYSQSSEPVDDNWYEAIAEELGLDESGESLIPVETGGSIPDVPDVPIPQPPNPQPPNPQPPIIETPAVTNEPVVSNPNVVVPTTITNRLVPDVNRETETVKKENSTFTIQRLILLAMLCVALYFGYKYIDKRKSYFGKYKYDISRAYDMVR
tara:strand:- start:460 stop:960 length:501 start_codon:yes stop_codon:yes gene_type:complete